MPVTTTKTTDAKKEAPAKEEPAEAASAKSEKATASETGQYENKMDRMQAILDKQPKVEIRVQKDRGPQTAIINGFRLNIPAGIPVKVPQQVAELLRDAEII